MIRRQFEIPYNFDQNLITGLKIIDPNGIHIHSIYMPPFKLDYLAAKNYYIAPGGLDMNQQQKFDRNEYENHVKNIEKNFPSKLMLLLQQNNILMSEDLLDYYINLGFTKFCVGSLSQAKEIRNKLPKAEIIGSITMKISLDNLLDDQYEIFDGFVLWFPYNRDYDLISQLPKKYHYILLVNCDCNITCDGTHHWFATLEQEHHNLCPNSLSQNFKWENIIRIRPMDLSIFDKYISYYKFQGRESLTTQILQTFCVYLHNYAMYPEIYATSELYKHK